MEKIILHAHSSWSHDSKITLYDWSEFLAEKRIDKVFLTEHEESGWDETKYDNYIKACRGNSTNNHQIIRGLELNIRGFHVLAPGLLSYKSRPNDDNLEDLKNWVVENGSFLVAAHPDKYSNYDPEVLRICDGVEIINTKHQYNWFFRRPTYRTFEIKSRFGLEPFVGEDIHRLSQYSKHGLMQMEVFDSLGFKSKLCQRRPLRSNDIMIAYKNYVLSVYMLAKKTFRS